MDDGGVYDRWVELPADETPLDAYDDPMIGSLTPALPDIEPPSSSSRANSACPDCERRQLQLDELRRKSQELRTLLINFFFPKEVVEQGTALVTQRMIELLVPELTEEELDWIKGWLG